MSDETGNDLFGDAIEADPQQIAEHLESDDLKSKWGRSLADIYDHFVSELKHHGQPP